MHTSFRPRSELLDPVLIDRAAETTVIAAWLAVPFFALLAGGALAPPLHAAGAATLLTLALRSWRSARRGQALEQIRERLAAYLAGPPLLPVPVQAGHARPRHRRGRHGLRGIRLAIPVLGLAAEPHRPADIGPYPGA